MEGGENAGKVIKPTKNVDVIDLNKVSPEINPRTIPNTSQSDLTTHSPKNPKIEGNADPMDVSLFRGVNISVGNTVKGKVVDKTSYKDKSSLPVSSSSNQDLITAEGIDSIIKYAHGMIENDGKVVDKGDKKSQDNGRTCVACRKAKVGAEWCLL